jgi:hypothetical protein
MGRSVAGVVEYRVVEGFPGYRVGDDGSVWSRWKRTQKAWIVGDEWRRMKPSPKQGGYLRVSLRGDGKRASGLVHVLVLTAFVGPCPDGKQARHDDGDPTNNRLDNLFWGTPKQNCDDRVRHGTAVRGVRAGCAKLSDSAVSAIIDRLSRGESKKAIARGSAVTETIIRRIAQGKAWTHVRPDVTRPIAASN